MIAVWIIWLLGVGFQSWNLAVAITLKSPDLVGVQLLILIATVVIGAAVIDVARQLTGAKS